MEGLAPAGEYFRFLVTLTAVLDPFLAVPIFLALTASYSPQRRARLARVTTITVFLVLAGSAFFGERLLVAFGASLAAFRVGGGLVVLLMALAMLNAEAGGVRQSREEAKELEAGEVSGVVPLAVPLLAGPGAISTTIIAAQSGGAAHYAGVIACVALVCAFTWVALSLAERIATAVSGTALNVATRILGLLLAALAIQTMAEGLKQLFPGLA
jgi:multiple antibiotic resistance protein